MLHNKIQIMNSGVSDKCLCATEFHFQNIFIYQADEQPATLNMYCYSIYNGCEIIQRNIILITMLYLMNVNSCTVKSIFDGHLQDFLKSPTGRRHPP
jgi:hypothetical protein